MKGGVGEGGLRNNIMISKAGICFFHQRTNKIFLEFHQGGYFFYLSIVVFIYFCNLASSVFN